MVETDCTFCDSSKFDDRIVTETEGFWVFPTIGQISEGGYLLIVPKEHYASLARLPPDLMDEFIDLREEVLTEIEEEYVTFPGNNIHDVTGVTGFEHGVCGQTVFHAHYHVSPTNSRQPFVTGHTHGMEC